MASAEERVERLSREGRWDELVLQANADLSAARLAQDPLRQSEALSLLTSVHGAMGNWKESLRAARSALRIRRQLRDALGTARALAGLSSAYATARGTRQALTLFQMANNAFRGLEEVEERCHAAAALSQIQLVLGQTREARGVLDEAIGLCENDDLAWCKWMLLELKSLACRADHDLDSAIRCLEEAFLLRQREGAISSACLRTIADLYVEGGRGWEGAEMYRMAINHAREHGAEAEVHRIEARIQEATQPSDPHRGRLTLPGLKAPAWERSH